MRTALPILALALELTTAALLVDPKKSPGTRGGVTSVPVDISNLRNNRAFARGPLDADFDGTGSGYPAHFLPSEEFVYGGVDFIFPQYNATGGNDNILAQGQILNITPGYYASVHMLVAAQSAFVNDFINATYADGSTSSSPLAGFPWWSWPSAWSSWHYAGDLVFPYHFTNETIDYNSSMIFRTVNWLDSTGTLASLQLPNVAIGSANGPGGAALESKLHIFAVSLISVSGVNISLDIQHARSTNLWLEGPDKAQVFEVTIVNAGTEWILAKYDVQVTIEAHDARALNPAHIYRLRPGDEARVQIGVINDGGPAVRTAKVVVSGIGMSTAAYTFNATLGIDEYEATEESIYAHESPAWFSDGKYGIFIHWGPYSVPGWGNVGNSESFAEWYWWWMNSGPNSTRERTYEYHLETYGPDVVFDDFIANLSAAAFDPKEWVDLFADAGATYFVQTAKQHDGYALFDLPSNISLRTSVAQFPHRNLLQGLFDAATEYQPQLRKGAYYSLPEWFHPDYHGFGEWPGGNATNPYTNETLPYLGYVPLDDYVADKVLPEMQILAAMGMDLLWCDVGGPNSTTKFAADFFNNAAKQGRQVSINNRCGIEGDFDTAAYTSLQRRKWEMTQSLDPFSYGYNRATPDDSYMKPQTIVSKLVDAVSKNGNLLLNVGPTAEGIIPSIQQRNLRAAGNWIKSHAEAIYNTTYWAITPEEGAAIRFTQTSTAFYIHALYAPNSTIALTSPVPYVLGDEVTVVGGKLAGTVVPSQLRDDGVLVLELSEAVRDADEFAWVFKIAYC